MNIQTDDRASNVAARRRANETFRRALPCGTIALSAGVASLGSTALDAIIAAIRDLDFDSDDDSDTHDIGDIEVLAADHSGQPVRQLVFFRIDRVTRCDAASHRLVLLLASEWWSAPAAPSEDAVP